MNPPVYPLTVYAGDTGHWRIILWKDKAKTRAVNLDGIDIQPTVGPYMMLVEVILPNVVLLTMPASVSGLLSGVQQWQLRLIKPDGEAQTIIRGPVSVMAGVS
jgi:hypothetical protein